MSQFNNLAQQIITKNDPNALAQMMGAICDLDSLQKLLKEIPYSDTLHFTFTELLGKAILAGEFCPINETKSDNNNMKDNTCQKTKLYEMIIPNLFTTICNKNFENKEYILRSALNTISICLKDLCDNNKNLGVFTNILENCLFIGWRANPNFTSCLNGDLTFIQPSTSVVQFFISEPKALQVFKYSAKIMIQFIEYITMATVYKNYYEYRRNIYTFRNTYLSTILNAATEYHKFLHIEWKNNPTNHDIIDVLSVSISLLQKTIAYPFSLTLHQYETEDEIKDSAIGLNSDIYFPSYYRNVLCDTSFLDMLFEFYMFLVKELNTVTQLGDTVYSLVRILGRIISASIYTFNSEDQRKIFRGYCTNMVITMLFNFKFYDTFYIFSLCDIFCKVLSSYTSVDLQDSRQKFYEGLMFFCELLVLNCPIKLQDGRRNPFNRVFQIVVNCISETKQTLLDEYIKAKSQQILAKAFLELQNPEYAQKILNQFGKNQRNQIQCFQQLFQNIPIVFAVNLDVNLINLKNLGVQNFRESQQTIWLHLCSVLLPNNLANRIQTEIILKYFKIAQNGNTMASLHYIQVLINQVLHDMQNGLPSTPLWSHIQDLQGCTFTDFTLYILRVCKKNFQQTNTEIIDYALEVFKSIYMKLKKHSSCENQTVDLKFNPFYNEVKELIGNLSNTVFENPKFFKRRVQLFSVISTIWINPENYRHLQEIYLLVSNKIQKHIESIKKLENKQMDLTDFLKYIHDMRGLLQPIQDFQSFKIICELSIADLSIILPHVFHSQEAINAIFGEEIFLKAFCKMILQFVTDFSRRLTYHIQTQLPFLIYDLFRPYLQEILNFDYPKSVVKIWQKFASLSPLQQMLPLIPSLKQKDPKQFSCLVKEYFDNIHRVPINQLESLYPYIEDKVEFLCQWWQEIVRRKLSPQVSLATVVESRIASSKRQKQELAKLVYFVGSYDQKYWNLGGFNDERQFVRQFLETYKSWRE